MGVEFLGEIKKLSVKKLVSLDKGGRLMIDFRIPTDVLINRINELILPDKEIVIQLKKDN